MISGLGNPRELCQLFHIGLLEYITQFRNLRFTVRRTTNIQCSVLSSSEDIFATYRAFRQSSVNSQLAYYYCKGSAKFYTEEDCDWLRGTFGDSQESRD